jgi:hypothetical protein
MVLDSVCIFTSGNTAPTIEVVGATPGRPLER